MTILYKEGATKAQEDEAQSILEALDAAYPNHPWGVRVYPGGFFIRHLDLPANYGMNCKGTYASSSLMKRDVILMAGEFLERAGIPRGRWDEDNQIQRVEGIPERFQPASQKPPVAAVVDTRNYEPLRTEARPQVEEIKK